MEQFFAFTGRNLKLYLRDRGAIFFSLLSMIIVIGLMVFFLGDMNVNAITDLLAQFPEHDPAADAEHAGLLVLAWTCAGILSINAVTVTLAVYSIMIKDRVDGKLSSIYTAPVSRAVIAGGYVCSAWVCSMFMCTATLIIAECFCCLKGMPVFGLLTHLQLLGMIAVNSFTFSTIMYVAALFAKTNGAWSGIGTVVGTLVGFLGAIYVPVGSLADSIVTVLKCSPVLYGTAMFRNVMTKAIMDSTFTAVPEEVVAEYRRVMGIDLTVGTHMVSVTEELLLLGIFGMIFLIVGIVLLKYSRKTDR